MARIILGIKSSVLLIIIVMIEAKKRPHVPSSTTIVCPKNGLHRYVQKECNRYFECSNGILFAKFCKPGKLYDMQKKKCLPARLVTCEDVWETITLRTRRSDGENNPDITFNSAGCPVDHQIKWKLPHAKCEKYYECKAGRPKVRKCPSGKLFDKVKLKCRKSSRVLCEQISEEKEINSEEKNENEKFKTKLNENGCPEDPDVVWRLPHQNCNQFYECKDGNMEAHRCPINLLYDTDTRTCESPDAVKCTNRFVNRVRMTQYNNKDKRSNQGSDAKEINKYTFQVRAEDVCSGRNSNGLTLPFAEPNGYYTCSDGEAVLMFCSAGLQYNHKMQKCDWFEPESQESFSTNAEQTCKTVTQNHYDTILLPHENCNMFYKCLKNIPIPRYCQSGYLFDTRLSRCDWAANVVCGLRSMEGY